MYSSHNTLRVSISRRRWGHVAYMGKMRSSYLVLFGNLRERDHLEDSGIDVMIILKSIFRNC